MPKMQHRVTDLAATKHGKQVLDQLRILRSQMAEDHDQLGRVPWISLADASNILHDLVVSMGVDKPYTLGPTQRAKLVTHLIRSNLQTVFDLFPEKLDPEALWSGPMVVSDRVGIGGQLCRPLFVDKYQQVEFYSNRPEVFPTKNSPHLKYDRGNQLVMPKGCISLSDLEYAI